jgi:hypothetical protein
MQQITYKSFVVSMVLCAALVLGMIWSKGDPIEPVPQIAATLFVLGLASFLLWFSSVLWDIRKRLK